VSFECFVCARVIVMSRSLLGEQEPHDALRILIIDDHTVYRAGLRGFIYERLPFSQISERGDLLAVLSEPHVLGSFDLVLMDVDPARFQPADLLKSALDVARQTLFAVISDCDRRPSILASLAMGFRGFISKRQLAADILDAIKDILSGRIYVPSLLATAADPERNFDDGRTLAAAASETDLLRLTPRQREVLSYLARGMSNKEIARALHIAEATAKVHAAALLRILGARNRTEAAFKAGRLIESAAQSPSLGPLPDIVAPAVREEIRLRLIRSGT